MAKALSALPQTRRALLEGRLSWSKVRLVASVASAQTERRWIRVAEGLTVRALSERIAAWRQEKQDGNDTGSCAGPSEKAREKSSGAATGACWPASRKQNGCKTQSEEGQNHNEEGPNENGPAGRREGCRTGTGEEEGPAKDTGTHAESATSEDVLEERLDGRPKVRFSLRCPHHVESAWRLAKELAERLAGSSLATWQAAEAIAAEALSGAPVFKGPSGPRRPARRPSPLIFPLGRPSGGNPAEPSCGSRRLSSGAFASPAGPRWHSLSRPASCGSDPLEPTFYSSDPLWRGRLRLAFPWLTWNSEEAALPDPLWRLVEDLDEGETANNKVDPFELDRRMRLVLRAMARLDFQLGRLLGLMRARRAYRWLGFSSLAHYATERLGFSPRKASLLASVERRSWQSSPQLTEALRTGRISLLKALALLPVIDEKTADAWLARAESVTLRRLCDETRWALDEQALGGHPYAVPPPPADWPVAKLTQSLCQSLRRCREQGVDRAVGGGLARGSAQRHVEEYGRGENRLECGRGEGRPQHCRGESHIQGGQSKDSEPANVCGPSAGLCDFLLTGRIAFVAPDEVAELLVEAIDAFRREGEPAWKGLWRALAHVIDEWLGQAPAHRDPIFERDGWRCMAPGCSARRNLHDHHVQPRSRGGTNEQTNRIALCAWHHLRGVHSGVVAVRGQAPSGLRWELGLRREGPPLMILEGETYVGGQRL